jgi:hypothetical protein
LLEANGVTVDEGRSGSRIGIRMGSKKVIIHKPHPQKVLKEYAVRIIRDFLSTIGVTP